MGGTAAAFLSCISNGGGEKTCALKAGWSQGFFKASRCLEMGKDLGGFGESMKTKYEPELSKFKKDEK
ncbi:MAG: hypothetical protein AAF799_30095 [Myxococcota bacterium]